MAFVMLGENNGPRIVQRILDQVRNPDLLLQPDLHGFEKAREPLRCIRYVRFKQPFKFEKGFVVEGHEIQIISLDPTFIQTVRDGMLRKIRVVLDP